LAAGARVRSTLRGIRMPTPALDPSRIPAWLSAFGPGMHATLGWAEQHTGLPAILVAAITVVVSWRVFKRSVRFAVEVVAVVALLLAATRLGWITW
jgi:hypothetical protein